MKEQFSSFDRATGISTTYSGILQIKRRFLFWTYWEDKETMISGSYDIVTDYLRKLGYEF